MNLSAAFGILAAISSVCFCFIKSCVPAITNVGALISPSSDGYICGPFTIRPSISAFLAAFSEPFAKCEAILYPNSTNI